MSEVLNVRLSTAELAKCSNAIRKPHGSLRLYQIWQTTYLPNGNQCSSRNIVPWDEAKGADPEGDNPRPPSSWCTLCLNDPVVPRHVVHLTGRCRIWCPSIHISTLMYIFIFGWKQVKSWFWRKMTTWKTSSSSVRGFSGGSDKGIQLPSPFPKFHIRLGGKATFFAEILRKIRLAYARGRDLNCKRP